MKEFKRCNPIVNIMYFMAVIVFSCVFTHPICLLISLTSAFVYSIMLNGKKAVKFNLMIVLPMMAVAAALNPLFNHEGVTILYYLPSNNPLTLESIINGVAVGVMTGSVIIWFSCYNAIITSDKLMYLTGKLIPSLSLVITMVLRFVPVFKTRFKEVYEAQKGIDKGEKKLLKKAENGVRILSVMVTWSLENAVEISQSMKSRGYGLGKRTSFSPVIFTKRDTILLLIIAALTIYIICGAVTGNFEFSYYPKISFLKYSNYNASIFFAYLALCIIPIIYETVEEKKWKLSRLKI